MEVRRRTQNHVKICRLIHFLVLERLRRSRFYGICYGTVGNKSITKTSWGYTNEFHMFDTFDKILSLQTHYFVAHRHCIARNEKDVKKAKEKDGGAVPMHEDLAHGNTRDDGWITKGCKSILWNRNYTTIATLTDCLVQDKYLKYLESLAQEKTLEDRLRRKV